jgi:transposase-like protein
MTRENNNSDPARDRLAARMSMAKTLAKKEETMTDKDREIADLRARLRKALSERDDLLARLQKVSGELAKQKKDDGASKPASKPTTQSDVAASTRRVRASVVRAARTQGRTAGDLARELDVDPASIGLDGVELLPTGMARAAGLLPMAAPKSNDIDGIELGAMSPDEARAIAERMTL